MNTLLEIKDVSASYNGALVLKDVNLKIKEGDFMGVIGPNGGGKTTLLKIIMGLMSPRNGELIFNKTGAICAIATLSVFELVIYLIFKHGERREIQRVTLSFFV